MTLKSPNGNKDEWITLSVRVSPETLRSLNEQARARLCHPGGYAAHILTTYLIGVEKADREVVNMRRTVSKESLEDETVTGLFASGKSLEYIATRLRMPRKQVAAIIGVDIDNAVIIAQHQKRFG